MAEKTLKEMSLTEKTDWATGELIVSIGQGKFRERVTCILMAIMSESFERGQEQVRKQLEEEAKPRKSKK